MFKLFSFIFQICGQCLTELEDKAWHRADSEVKCPIGHCDYDDDPKPRNFAIENMIKRGDVSLDVCNLASCPLHGETIVHHENDNSGIDCHSLVPQKRRAGKNNNKLWLVKNELQLDEKAERQSEEKPPVAVNNVHKDKAQPCTEALDPKESGWNHTLGILGGFALCGLVIWGCLKFGPLKKA